MPGVDNVSAGPAAGSAAGVSVAVGSAAGVSVAVGSAAGASAAGSCGSAVALAVLGVLIFIES